MQRNPPATLDAYVAGVVRVAALLAGRPYDVAAAVAVRVSSRAGWR